MHIFVRTRVEYREWGKEEEESKIGKCKVNT